MSEKEIIELYARLGESMKCATRSMLERKAKLGETVVIADANGCPVVVSAEEALRLFSADRSG